METSSITTFPVSQQYTCAPYLNHAIFFMYTIQLLCSSVIRTSINENQSETLKIMKGK